MTGVLHAGLLAGWLPEKLPISSGWADRGAFAGVAWCPRGWVTFRLGSPGRVCGGRGVWRGPVCGPSSGR